MRLCYCGALAAAAGPPGVPGSGSRRLSACSCEGLQEEKAELCQLGRPAMPEAAEDG